MRVPVLWLNDYVDPGLPAEELAARLDMTGTAVERIHRHGVDALEFFRVGRVLSAERHPDADRLTVCMVDIGDGEQHQIVCGAPNVAAGQTVAVASPGAVMPDGTRLKKAKLRGQESRGMILAEDEVGIGTDHDGIMTLPEALEVGSPLADALPIATEVLELEVTPNRPDCLAVYGIAREVHAATGAPLAPPPWSEDPGTPGEVAGASVLVEDPDLCPRFTARLFEDVEIGPSPAWLKARLMAAGQRPINNVVDITNYVMLLTGQPLHAFDFDLVAGGTLTVRRAGEGEKLTTLDDVERTLDSEMLLIADADGPTSIAGLMGGERSEVRGSTTRVLMEAANWNGPNLQRTSAKLALRTEASGRFEKGIAPEQAMDGQIVATHLMLELTGARLAEGTIDVGGPGPEPKVVRLRDEKVERLLGLAIPREESARILTALQFGVADADDGLDVTVPGFRRNDVYREADLVEEVSRIYGLDKLPYTLPSRRGASGRLEPAQRARRRIEDALVGAGLHEAVGWSFTSPDFASRLRLAPEELRGRPVRLRNPMSEEQAVLRTTLLGSLLDSTQRNLSRGTQDVRLFEAGAVYLDRARENEPRAAEPLPDERTHLGALLTGALRPPSWREPAPPRADFFSAKAVLAAALDAVRADWSVEPAREPFLHPGRAARVIVGGESAGWLGELHPSVVAGWDIERAAGFELDLAVLVAAARLDPPFEDLTSFPSVRQDRAWWFPATVAAGEVLAVVREAGGALLAHADVFDVYPDGERTSLALRLEFRAPDRTLTDEEVAQRRAKIDAAVAERLGASRVASVAVLGAAGYAGAVAASLLHRHPELELRHVTARSDAGARLDEVHPRTRVPLTLEAPTTELDVDAAIVAYPHGASAPVVAALLERGIRVVDLSADFRLRDLATYEDYYGPHPAPELIGEAVYGLPELYRDEIRGARLVANPGCYPTASILALHPLSALLADVVIDAKSGVSGAGREPSQGKHFVSVDETVTPYKVGRHRHTPEIRQELGVDVTFTPHLVPLSYGELVSCYVTPSEGVDAPALYRDAYADEPWVEVVEGPPGMHEVRETNYCRISVHADGSSARLIVFATIDNLYKGTSSQAVQNLNLMFGLDESLGLPG